MNKQGSFMVTENLITQLSLVRSGSGASPSSVQNTGALPQRAAAEAVYSVKLLKESLNGQLNLEINGQRGQMPASDVVLAQNRSQSFTIYLDNGSALTLHSDTLVISEGNVQTFERLLSRYALQSPQLSDSARLISDLSVSIGNNSPPPRIMPSEPLMPVPVGAAEISSQLPQALRHSIQISGLFYESHQAQWVNGEYPLVELQHEPQAALAVQSQKGNPDSGSNMQGDDIASQIKQPAQQSNTPNSAAGTETAAIRRCRNDPLIYTRPTVGSQAFTENNAYYEQRLLLSVNQAVQFQPSQPQPMQNQPIQPQSVQPQPMQNQAVQSVLTQNPSVQIQQMPVQVQPSAQQIPQAEGQTLQPQQSQFVQDQGWNDQWQGQIGQNADLMKPVRQDIQNLSVSANQRQPILAANMVERTILGGLTNHRSQAETSIVSGLTSDGLRLLANNASLTGISSNIDQRMAAAKIAIRNAMPLPHTPISDQAHNDQIRQQQTAAATAQHMGRTVDTAVLAGQTIASFVRYSKAFEQLTGVSSADTVASESNPESSINTLSGAKTLHTVRCHNEAVLRSRFSAYKGFHSISTERQSAAAPDTPNIGRLSAQQGAISAIQRIMTSLQPNVSEEMMADGSSDSIAAKPQENTPKMLSDTVEAKRYQNEKTMYMRSGYSGLSTMIPASGRFSSREIRQRLFQFLKTAAVEQRSMASASAPHPDTLPIVKQQLQLLSEFRLMWSGELWSGQRMEMAIEADQHKDAQHSLSGDDAPKSWKTTLKLVFPHLGAITASLWIDESDVKIWLNAANHDTRQLLQSDFQLLLDQMKAAEVPLSLLQLSTNSDEFSTL